METEIVRQRGRLHEQTQQGTVTVPRSHGLHSETFIFLGSFHYPIVIEHAAACYQGTTRGDDAAVDVLETIPRVKPLPNEEECEIGVTCAYELSAGARESRRDERELEFEYQVIFRESDEIDLRVRG